MQTYPEWVPEEVVTYYQELLAQQHPDAEFEFAESDMEALHRCIKSPVMEKAWQAITRRKEKCEPQHFAFSIVFTAMSCRKLLPQFPTPAEIASYERLLKKVEELHTDFDTAFEHWTDARLNRFFFGGPPAKKLEKLEEDLSHVIRTRTLVRKRLKGLSGQPKSKNAKRAYVVRLLSENIRSFYGQPLHKVIALTASSILQTEIDEETARKLVS